MVTAPGANAMRSFGQAEGWPKALCESVLPKPRLPAILGARMGDLFMSLIHTAQLCGASPFEYLTEGCLNDAQKLKGLVGVELRENRWVDWPQMRFHCASGTHAEAKKLSDTSFAIVVENGPSKGRAGIAGAECIQR